MWKGVIVVGFVGVKRGVQLFSSLRPNRPWERTKMGILGGIGNTIHQSGC